MNGNVEEINDDDDENLSLTEEQQENLKQGIVEISKKVGEYSESLLVPVTEKLIEAGKKFKIRYEEKKRLWEQDRNYYKNKGFDREFEEMIFESAKLNPEINRKTIGQIFGMEKDEFRDLFDDWFVRYEGERDKKVAEKRKLVMNTSTDAALVPPPIEKPKPEPLTFINSQFGDVLRTMLERNGITFKKGKAFDLVCLLYLIQDEINGTFDFETCEKLAVFLNLKINKSEFSRNNHYSKSMSKDKPSKNLFSQRVEFVGKQLKATAAEKSIKYKVPIIE